MRTHDRTANRSGGAGTGPLAPLALGFRPFYLAAGLFAALALLLWLGFLWGVGPVPTFRNPAGWHAHEMVYGFAVAVMAGFLLTAVRAWTGRPTPTGAALLGLVALWLAGRTAMLAAAALPAWLVTTLDVAFLPVLAASLAAPLWHARARRNWIFPVLLLALAGANLVVHLRGSDLPIAGGDRSLRFALNLITLAMVVIGGRVIPAFTANALPGLHPRTYPWLDGLALASVALLTAIGLGWDGQALGWAALAAALANGARLLAWRPLATRRVPLLWILHVGYAWIVVSFVLEALAILHQPMLRPLAVHALTVGAIGSLTLGMMTRSALGHTGRALQASAATTLAYGLVNLAALTRALLPIAFPGAYMPAVLISGLLWSAAFAMFVAEFWPVLTRPRVDGQSG